MINNPLKHGKNRIKNITWFIEVYWRKSLRTLYFSFWHSVLQWLVFPAVTMLSNHQISTMQGLSLTLVTASAITTKCVNAKSRSMRAATVMHNYRLCFRRKNLPLQIEAVSQWSLPPIFPRFFITLQKVCGSPVCLLKWICSTVSSNLFHLFLKN